MSLDHRAKVHPSLGRVPKGGKFNEFERAGRAITHFINDGILEWEQKCTPLLAVSFKGLLLVQLHLHIKKKPL